MNFIDELSSAKHEIKGCYWKMFGIGGTFCSDYVCIVCDSCWTAYHIWTDVFGISPCDSGACKNKKSKSFNAFFWIQGFWSRIPCWLVMGNKNIPVVFASVCSGNYCRNKIFNDVLHSCGQS